MQTNQAVSAPARSPLLLGWIALISAWVMAGAVFKLVWGTPALLPEVIRDLPLELGATYNLAIGIELAIALVALTKPRWGWILQAALLVVFDVVLTTQIAAGTENCGCFGNKLSMPPWVMMTIDSVLLVGLLVQKPWARLGPGLPLPVPVGLAAVVLAVPWFMDRQVALEEGDVEIEGEVVKQGQWIELDIEDWVGTDVWDTPLGKAPLSSSIDVYSLPLDGLWVFWRATCDHCAEHLAHMAETETGERLLALIQLEEKTDTLANRVVHTMPDGNYVVHARLPAGIEYLLQTPGEMLVEGGRITAAVEGVSEETALGKGGG